MTQILNFKYRLRGRGSQQRRAEAECFSINWQKDERRRGEAKKKDREGTRHQEKNRTLKENFGAPCTVFALALMRLLNILSLQSYDVGYFTCARSGFLVINK